MSDIIFEFRGQTYRLPESMAFEACEAIEEVAFLGEMVGWLTRPKFAKLGRCTAILLRMAGADVTDKEVKGELIAAYRDMRHKAVFGAVTALHAVLFDGVPESVKGEVEAPAGKAAAGKPNMDSLEPPS